MTAPDTPPSQPKRSGPDGFGPESFEPGDAVRMIAWVRGRVQGVGFRWFTRAQALTVGGIRGYVVNLQDGRVQVVAEGPRERCERLLEWLRTGDTPGRVDGVTEIWDTPRGGAPGFGIR